MGAEDSTYFRPENVWKPVKVGGRPAWRAVVRGHELYAQNDKNKNYFLWWLTSDKDGLVITARGKAKLLSDAQTAALNEARTLAYGELSTRAFLPSEKKAIRDGSFKRIDGQIAEDREKSGR